jgi:hypothetical protein
LEFILDEHCYYRIIIYWIDLHLQHAYHNEATQLTRSTYDSFIESFVNAVKNVFPLVHNLVPTSSYHFKAGVLCHHGEFLMAANYTLSVDSIRAPDLDWDKYYLSKDLENHLNSFY